MSDKDNQKAQEEELKKLEEEAYFELCQIIAEALQLQDIKVLNSRLSSWKIKYKKLLDGSTPNSALIEKIKRLQSDNYIAYIIDMIMQRIKITEYVKIENQAKALSKLYSILKKGKENNDFTTLKSKVEEWKKTYPIQSFMKMYQKKYADLTSTETIKENSFDQEKAFYDLIQITKIDHPDDIKNSFEKWEDTYHIHDKFELDDFIKHQSDVKRYVQEIESKVNPDQEDGQSETQETSEQFSDFAKQSMAVNSLLSIIEDSNNLNKVFEWVHKNSSIKFNDEFKALILSKTALEYSPKYLNRLKAPNINVLSGSLSLDEYKEIDNIKRYAVISYFNLLLPKGQAIPNNYFDNYVEDIYYKSKNVKVSDTVTVPEKVTENNVPSEEETKLEVSFKVSEKPVEPELDATPETTYETAEPEFVTFGDLDINFEEPLDEYPDSFEIDLSKPTTNWHTISDTDNSTYTLDTTYSSTDSEQDLTIENEETPAHTIIDDIPESITHSEVTVEENSTAYESLTPGIETTVSDEVSKDEEKNEEIDIIGYSPLLFDAIYNLSVQANMIRRIDNSAEQHIGKRKNTGSIDILKNKLDS